MSPARCFTTRETPSCGRASGAGRSPPTARRGATWAPIRSWRPTWPTPWATSRRLRRRPLIEHLLFWQDWISYPAKFQLAACGVAITLGPGRGGALRPPATARAGDARGAARLARAHLFGRLRLASLPVERPRRDRREADGRAQGKRRKLRTGVDRRAGRRRRIRAGRAPRRLAPRSAWPATRKAGSPSGRWWYTELL